MNPSYRVTRDVTVDECPWLDNTVTEGTTVYEFHNATYGCVNEFAACLDPEGDYPFFELPYSAVEKI